MVPAEERSSVPSKAVFEIVADGVAYQMYLPDFELDYIQSGLARTHEPYEHEMLKVMAAGLRPGALVVDAGANVGNHTLFLAATSGAAVYAFEPNRHLADAIGTSASLNGLTGLITVIDRALGVAAGRAHLGPEDPSNLGGRTVEVDEGGEIVVVALDEVDLPDVVAAIKIDVEGSEMAVLQGAAGLIAKDRPTVFVECIDEQRFLDVDRFMRTAGYLVADQFNATPTFQYVPVESLTVAERYDRVISRAIAESLRDSRLAIETRHQLEHANLKYRASTSEVRRVSAELKLRDAELETLCQRAATFEGEIAALQTSLEESACALLEAAQAREELELRANSLQHTIAEHERVTEAHAARVALLERALQVARAGTRDLAVERDRASARIEDLARSLADAQDRSQQFGRQLLASQTEIDRLIAEGVSTQERLQSLTDALATSGLEASAATSRAHAERSRATTASARADTEAARAAREAERANIEAMRAEKAALAARQADNERAASVSEAARLREAVAAATSAVRDVEARLSIATREVDRLRRELTASRLEAAQSRDLVAALRASVTMRTGKLIRSAVGSPRGLLALPVRLWRLQREFSAAADRVIEKAPPSPEAAHLRTAVAATIAPLPVAAGDATAVMQERVVANAHDGARAGRLRVAAIMDEFTRLSFGPEWDITDLTPDGWLVELGQAAPDLLFIESAWRGIDELWHNSVSRAGSEIQGILKWCHENGVPTAFWNKEDPVHFSTFLNVAALFDHVFTTDIDCVPRYKAALGHDRVSFLPFAAQPAVHNPIVDSDRRDAFMFAGAYYRRYPDRTRDLESFVEALPAVAPIDIYDRNFGKSEEAYMFPDEYGPLIVGSLPPDRMHEAYKQYKFAINLNSVKQSQSMFARRAFELLACGTITVSNFARGLRTLLGDLTICTDSGQEAVRRLVALQAGVSMEHLRLAGLRAVMRDHTYAHSALVVWARVNGGGSSRTERHVLVLAHADSQRDADRVSAVLQSQAHANWTALITLGEGCEWRSKRDDRVVLHTTGSGAQMTVRDVAGDADAVVVLAAGDHYGPHYLTDLALALTYSDATVVGKGRQPRWSSGSVELNQEPCEYRTASRLRVRSSLVRAAAVQDRTVAELLSDADTGVWTFEDQIAIDRFNYCQSVPDGFAAAEFGVDDASPWQGVDIYKLYAMAAAAEASEAPAGFSGLQPGDLRVLFGSAARPDLYIEPDGDAFTVVSTLADDAHDYLYAAQTVDVEASWPDRSGRLYFSAGVGADVQLALVFFDGDGQRCGSAVILPNRNATVVVPAATMAVKYGLRIRGKGAAEVKSIEWRHRSNVPGTIASDADVLVLTNVYPSYDSLYRNGFVHSRIRGYQARGLRTDVAAVAAGADVRYREFEGVDVLSGDGNIAKVAVKSGRYSALLVHFLDREIWSVIEARPAGVRAVVWIHGSEVQPWWRRSYNYSSTEELEFEKVKSAERLAFWRDVFHTDDPDLHFVFVSEYFADEVMEDVGVQLDRARYSIIHNPIDIDIFEYHEKVAEDRHNILSIRPFASRKYANDLSVSAILHLTEEPEFGQMQITFIGDGELFDETLEPIIDLPNVTVERRFLSQLEIADYHRRNGIFLVPTRMDAQGVSRDEAMASGLVPVSNAVAAVPEFVDEGSGMLVPGDDAEAIAEALIALVRDPDRFLRLSRGAAERVRAQSAGGVILDKEIALIQPPSAKR